LNHFLVYRQNYGFGVTAGAPGAVGGFGAPGALGGFGAPGALGATGAFGAAFIAAMICASVAPQLAHSLAVDGFMKLHIGHSISGAAIESSAPHWTHTVAIGLFALPHFEQVFIEICAGLKHIKSPYFLCYVMSYCVLFLVVIIQPKGEPLFSNPPLG
jgi:hypothetical protein